jgi:hypothetical protein
VLSARGVDGRELIWNSGAVDVVITAEVVEAVDGIDSTDVVDSSGKE